MGWRAPQSDDLEIKLKIFFF